MQVHIKIYVEVKYPMRKAICLQPHFHRKTISRLQFESSPEAVVTRCSSKKVLLILQLSQEKTFKNTFFTEHLWWLLLSFSNINHLLEKDSTA